MIMRFKNLEVLVEVHDKEELERAQVNPKIIGVNNRFKTICNRCFAYK